MQLLELGMMSEALFLRYFGRDPKYRGPLQKYDSCFSEGRRLGIINVKEL